MRHYDVNDKATVHNKSVLLMIEQLHEDYMTFDDYMSDCPHAYHTRKLDDYVILVMPYDARSNFDGRAIKINTVNKTLCNFAWWLFSKKNFSYEQFKGMTEDKLNSLMAEYA